MSEHIRKAFKGIRVDHKIFGQGVIKCTKEFPLIKIRFDSDKFEIGNRSFYYRSLAKDIFYVEDQNTTVNEYLKRIKTELAMHRSNSYELEKEKKDLYNRILTDLQIDNILYCLKDISSKLSIKSPELNQDDIRLAFNWSDKLRKFDIFNYSNLHKLLIGKFGDNWELGRLLSARAAEKAAMTYYRQYGFIVQDISIQQLTYKDYRSDWKDYDLIVGDNQFIDIKNSRRSKNSPDRYVEHCVPSFKTTRNNCNVTISGVLSPYLWTSNLIEIERANTDTSILFLGETSTNKQYILQKEFESSNLIVLNFKRPNSNSSYLPPWIFDTPNCALRKLKKILSEIKLKNIHKLINPNLLEINVYPLLLRSGNYDFKNYQNINFDPLEKSFFDDMSRILYNYQPSLPFIFLAVLKHFIKMAIENKVNFSPQLYKRFFFFRGLRKYPLIVPDPLETIYGLIEALSILWNYKKEAILGFKQFRLLSYNIFQGKIDRYDNQWKNLIAYCGGRTKDGSKCGKNPLVYGESELCNECGKLICPECNFCSESCKEYHNRIVTKPFEI